MKAWDIIAYTLPGHVICLECVTKEDKENPECNPIFAGDEIEWLYCDDCFSTIVEPFYEDEDEDEDEENEDES